MADNSDNGASSAMSHSDLAKRQSKERSEMQAKHDQEFKNLASGGDPDITKNKDGSWSKPGDDTKYDTPIEYEMNKLNDSKVEK